jgi:hypothetical protein
MGDTTAMELLPIAVFRQKRLAAEATTAVHDSVFEGLLFESMKGVVMDENADRSLGRE